MSHLPLPSPILSKVAAQAFDIVESLIPDSWKDPAQSRYVANLQSSLEDFCAEAWHIVEPQTPLSWNWHLTELCRVLEAVTRGDDGYDRVIINIPPGSMKSLLVSVFWPAWEWCRDPGLRYLTFSYSDVNTIRDNRRMRDIVTSDWYRRYFPHVVIASDQAGKVRFDNTAKGYRIASSVGGMGTGEHPDRIIVDDPSKAGDARSEVALAAVSDWIDRTLSTRVMRNPAIIVIMQRLHLEDLTGHLLAKGGWTLVRFPARYRGREVDKEGRETWTPDPRDHRTVPGELLWPEKWPEDKVLREENELGPFGAAGQLGQDPVPEGGGLFKRESFPVVEAAPATARRCRGWDTADTPGGGNWTVGARLAYEDATGLIYIEHVERAQSGPGEVNARIRETATVDGKRVQIAEGSGAGKAVTLARSKMLAGYDYTVMPETSATGDKVTRANAFRAQAEAGNVRLVRGPWNDAYLSVITSFPVGKYDDDVDATAHAYNRLVQGITEKRRATWGAPRTPTMGNTGT